MKYIPDNDRYDYFDEESEFYDALVKYVETMPFSNPHYSQTTKQMFYDQIWGYVQNHKDYLKRQFNLFSGQVVRVIGCEPNDVWYDGYLTHWTYDVNSFMANTFQKEPARKYTFVVANVTDGLWVNQFLRDESIRFEHEVIAPITKDMVSEVFYGTFKEFREHMGLPEPDWDIGFNPFSF